MKLNKILSTETIAAITAVSVSMSAAASGYYNAVAEAEQICSLSDCRHSGSSGTCTI